MLSQFIKSKYYYSYPYIVRKNMENTCYKKLYAVEKIVSTGAGALA